VQPVAADKNCSYPLLYHVFLWHLFCLSHSASTNKRLTTYASPFTIEHVKTELTKDKD